MGGSSPGWEAEEQKRRSGRASSWSLPPDLWGWSCPSFLQASSQPPSIHVSFWGPLWGGPIAGSSARTITSSAFTTQRRVLSLGLPSSLST